MIIKKFVGKTEKDALEAAKKELGSGVVIMNVKNIKCKGFMALFRPRQTEITVALEEENDTLKSVRRESAPRESVPRQGGNEGRENGRQTEFNAVVDNSQNIEKKLDSLQKLLVSRFQQSEAERAEIMEEDDSQYYEGEEEYEEYEEREELTEQQRFIRLLYNTMIESEVDEKYANQIVDEVDLTSQANLPIDYILENVYQKMVLKFGRAEGITPGEGAAKIVLFMGPTGVGKTTTIAKIASNYVVEEKKRVALLTADTYRIAAVEQLRTYANILEVPFRVIYSEEEARQAVEEFRNFDYIFMDTAGHSHQNEAQLDNMRKLFTAMKEAGECQAFLVLSATTKYRDLLNIVSRYHQITEYQLIFTKLDETDFWGNLLNMKLYTDAPIAFVTYGQDVPNDIERFNPQKTVRQILSTKHEKIF